MGITYIEKHEYQEAIDQIQKAIDTEGRYGIYLMQLARVYVLTGRKTDALKILDEMKDPSNRERIAAHDVAVVYTALGDKDQAFAWLDRAVAQQDFNLVYLKVAPYFAPLRSDPRFSKLLEKVGLGP
jgi:tetratricopeptide (TPR) repeat protein